MSAERFPIIIAMNTVLAFAGFLMTWKEIPNLAQKFINKNLYGIDMNKTSKEKVPESMGVVCGTIYIIIMFVNMFIEFLPEQHNDTFPWTELTQYVSALLCIVCMLLLGFCDDVFDLAWRYKLVLPTIASLPLLFVYHVTSDLTVIIVPKPFRGILGFSVDIGVLYYVYMGMLAVFCTNAINIVAGINGIEAGQSLVIALSVICFNLIELSGDFPEAHMFSLYFMIPFAAVTIALLGHNWYPSRVFVGDTYCYFAGMTFAVVAILGHFSKTMLLFFIPQIINFVFGMPQLFRLIHCPRHRLPKYNPTTDLLECSYSRFKVSSLGLLGRTILSVYGTLGLCDVRYNIGEDNDEIECSNMTIIVLALRIFGPTHEAKLTTIILCFAVACSILGLVIRYPLAALFYA